MMIFSQIDSMEYTLPFAADSRKLYKIGVSFDSAERKFVGWEVEEGWGNRGVQTKAT